MARSRLTISASVGVWTRPSDSTLRVEPTFVVAARVAFMPTSQSASLRARAAASSGRIASSSRSAAKASLMAPAVMELNQARLHRLLARRLGRRLEDELEDELALAPGVAGVDDLVDVRALHQGVERLERLRRARVAGLVAEALREDRAGPRSATSCSGRRRPRGRPARPGGRRRGRRSRRGPPSGRRLLGCAPEQGLGDVLGHGGLLADDEGSGHRRRRVAPGPRGSRPGLPGPADLRPRDDLLDGSQTRSGTVLSSLTRPSEGDVDDPVAAQRGHPAEAALGDQLGGPHPDSGWPVTRSKAMGVPPRWTWPEHDRSRLGAGRVLDALGEGLGHARPWPAARGRTRRPRPPRPRPRASPPR